jgi:2-polyprenyl-3-methyl-5-hydroxy-6-metoxy-1,4-benzoquinol methylase
MAYADPVRSDLADGTYYDRQAQPYHLSPAKLQSDYAPVRFVRERRLLRRFCRGGEVLDVGCSTGAFLFHLQQAGPYRGTGLDVAGAALDHAAAQGLEVIRGPLLEHDFGARRFDAVTFWAVLEHVAEPGAHLEKAAALLRPGGHCFVLVPNLRSLAIRWLGTKYRYVLPEHINYFTAATLEALGRRIPGLPPLWLGSIHFNPMVIWQDWRRPGQALVPPEDRARLLQQTTALKQSLLWRPARCLWAAVEKSLGAARWADNLVLVSKKRA